VKEIFLTGRGLILVKNYYEEYIQETNEVLAPCYLPKGRLLKYYRRCNVSQPSSGWIGVVPVRHKHQDLKSSKL
jgi:hypothetical protein